MYLPYLRGKKHELLALTDMVGEKTWSERFLPIIEPVNEKNKDFKDFLLCMKENNKGFIFITNPIEGIYSEEELDEEEEVNLDDLINEVIKCNENTSVAFIIKEETSHTDVKEFFDKYKTQKTYLIHMDALRDYEGCNLKEIVNEEFKGSIFVNDYFYQDYVEKFSFKGNYVVKDCFQQKSPNHKYPSSSPFDCNVFNYKENGFSGFGDFTICPQKLTSGGSIPAVVAMHITYSKEEIDAIRIKHCKSIKPKENEDKIYARKVIEAYTQVQTFVTGNKEVFSTTGLTRLLDLAQIPKATSLGYLKQHQMLHHMESILQVMNKREQQKLKVLHNA